MNIICTGNPNKKDFHEYLVRIVNYIESSYQEKVYVDEFVKDGNMSLNVNYTKIYGDCIFDLVICIGGDGALLSAVRRMKKNQYPILGIHIGTLGFLNTSTKSNYLDSIKYILEKSKEMQIYKKPLISTDFINYKNNKINFLALNEVCISQSYVSRVLELNVLVDNIKLNKYKCDGLIIASPTGSTAYSLSAGGPIVHHNVNGYVITPVSPFSLSSRSIVVNDNSIIKIICSDSINDISIFSDGQQSEKILPGSHVKVEKSNISAKIIKVPTDMHYFQRLRKQLGWSK